MAMQGDNSGQTCRSNEWQIYACYIILGKSLSLPAANDYRIIAEHNKLINTSYCDMYALSGSVPGAARQLV